MFAKDGSDSGSSGLECDTSDPQAVCKQGWSGQAASMLLSVPVSRVSEKGNDAQRRPARGRELTACAVSVTKGCRGPGQAAPRGNHKG